MLRRRAPSFILSSVLPLLALLGGSGWGTPARASGTAGDLSLSITLVAFCDTRVDAETRLVRVRCSDTNPYRVEGAAPAPARVRPAGENASWTCDGVARAVASGGRVACAVLRAGGGATIYY